VSLLLVYPLDESASTISFIQCFLFSQVFNQEISLFTLMLLVTASSTVTESDDVTYIMPYYELLIF